MRAEREAQWGRGACSGIFGGKGQGLRSGDSRFRVEGKLEEPGTFVDKPFRRREYSGFMD